MHTDHGDSPHPSVHPGAPAYGARGKSFRGYPIQQDEGGDKDRLDSSTLATHENHLDTFFRNTEAWALISEIHLVWGTQGAAWVGLPSQRAGSSGAQKEGLCVRREWSCRASLVST